MTEKNNLVKITRPNIVKIIDTIDKAISSDRKDGEYQDFIVVDLFGTNTNMLYVFHTGSLIRRFFNDDDSNWGNSIRNNPVFTKFDERILQRLIFGMYAVSEKNDQDMKVIRDIDGREKRQVSLSEQRSNGLSALIAYNVYKPHIPEVGDKIWFRNDFHQDFRDKYIAIVIDSSVSVSSDIQKFVMDDIKTRMLGRKKTGFIPSLKDFLTAYLKTAPIPTQKEVDDPFSLNDDFKEAALLVEDTKVESNISTTEFTTSMRLISNRNTITAVASTVGVGATVGSAVLGLDPYITGGLGVVGMVIVPIIFFRMAGKSIRKKLDIWQDRVSEKELEEIERRL